MPAQPKPNEIPVFLKDGTEGKAVFVFDDDRNKEIPSDTPIYLNDNDTDIAIGTAPELSDNVFYFTDEDDKDNEGNYLYDAKRNPIGFVKNIANSFYIKQTELVGGNEAQPPSSHPRSNEINNLVVGNEYDFVIRGLDNAERRIYRGTLMPIANPNVQDPTLKISNYTMDGVAQDGIRTFPLSWVISDPTEPPPQPPHGGGKKNKSKKTKKVKKTKKAKKSKKAKKTQRKSIRSRRRRRR
jgi:hypothetical protein